MYTRIFGLHSFNTQATVCHLACVRFRMAECKGRMLASGVGIRDSIGYSSHTQNGQPARRRVIGELVATYREGVHKVLNTAPAVWGAHAVRHLLSDE